jgi:hypothetical protein
MSQTDLITRYRAAAAKVREMEAAADLDRLCSTHIVSPGYTHMANLTEEIGEAKNQRGRCIAMIPSGWSDLICASRNLLPPLLDAGDALVRMLEDFDYLGRSYGESLWTTGAGYVLRPRAIECEAALTALVEALEREIP